MTIAPKRGPANPTRATNEADKKLVPPKISMDPTNPGPYMLREIERLGKRADQAELHAIEQRKAQHKMIVSAYWAGIPREAIAESARLTRQRVHQLVQDAEKRRPKRPKRKTKPKEVVK